MRKRIVFSLLGLILIDIFILHAYGSWVPVPNGSFESGSVGSIPDRWSMVTGNWDEHGGTTFTNGVQQIATKSFEGARSLWLHSRVDDTDGTRQMRDAWTEAVTEDWINAPSATHVRIFMRDIESTHSVSWGWSNHLFLLINNASVAKTYSGGVWYDMLFTHGEFLSWNHYNYTATGADGQSWYVYEYSIPESVDKAHMKIQIVCNAHDWTFYSTSYFSDLEFFVDKVELFELVPNGSFEEGTLCTVPSNWVMKTWDRDGEEPVPGATYLHDVCENDTHYFSGSRSCWLYSKVIDADGTKASRYSWTWIESENWINAPGATYVRFHIRDIQPKHTPGLWWGWNDGIYIGFNDSDTDRIYDYFIYNNGETLNFNHYNSTKIGADGATWYEYIYRIPADIDTSQMRFRIICIAGDWTFYNPSYFAEMSFCVDDVDFLCQATPSVSISPLSAHLVLGQSAAFVSTTSDGAPPYGYQWYLDGSPVSSAVSENWSFTPTTLGTYDVSLRVTDSLGVTAESNHAMVKVDTFHEIAGKQVLTSKTGCLPMPTIGKGYSAFVYVTVANQGNFTENIDVTVYATNDTSTTSIGTQNIEISSQQSATIAFTWNTESFSYGDYVIKAVAAQVPGEIDLSNNEVVDGNIRIVIPGDANGDKKVDLKDIYILAKSYGSTPGQLLPPWNPNCDINNDSKIDLKDYYIASRSFGKTQPP